MTGQTIGDLELLWRLKRDKHGYQMYIYGFTSALSCYDFFYENVITENRATSYVQSW